MRTVPSISVVIPAYNCAHTLKRAVQSVFDQTYSDYEIIIIDDGSTDDTLKIIGQFHDSRLRFVRHKKSLGAAAARNAGIKAAEGNIIAFLDADDEWLPNKLLYQVSQLNKKQQSGACFCGFYLRSERFCNEMYGRVIIPTNHKNWYKHLMMGCGLGPGTNMIVRRKWFDEIGFFDESLKRYEDWDWVLRLSNLAMLEVIKLPLAKINRGSPPPASIIEEASQIFLQKRASEFLKYGAYGRKAIAKRWLEVALHFYYEKKFRKGNFYLRKGLMYYPFQKLGYYLMILDAVLGTSISIHISNIFEKYIRHKNGKL